MQPSDDDGGVTGLTDAHVFSMALPDSTWVWYKSSPDTLSPVSDSPHAQQLRTRYNTEAATQLDAQGKVKREAVFPDSSIIVKEIYANGLLARLAVMLKKVGDPSAGHGDWLWGEYNVGGSVAHSITTDDGVCHNCHVRGEDHTRMNDAHP
jgi:hypothetical protein